MRKPGSVGDRIPPMVVKEVRQGLTSGVFVSLFLLFQAGMCLIHVVALVQSVNEVSALSFGAHIVLLFFLLPGAAAFRIRTELNERKFELVVLSGLDEKGLVHGIYAAMYAQAVLFVVSGVPYWVLRHYLGGTDIAQELLVLGFLLLIASVPLGLATGMSPYRWYENLIGGVFFGLILIPGGIAFMGAIASSLVEVGVAWPFIALILYVIFGVPAILLFLALGSVRIRERMVTPPAYV